MVGVLGVVGVVEVNRVVEVVYRHEENLGVKGPNKNNNNKDVGLPMTMPQAAGKKYLPRGNHRKKRVSDQTWKSAVKASGMKLCLCMIW